VSKIAVVIPALLVLIHPAGLASPSTDKACRKLRDHVVVAEAIHVKNGIWWNGTKVTRARFDAHLREVAGRKPKEVIHLTWEPAEEPRAVTLEREIYRQGVALAIDCPPIPF
jgi:hypothetical protein